MRHAAAALTISAALLFAVTDRSEAGQHGTAPRQQEASLEAPVHPTTEADLALMRYTMSSPAHVIVRWCRDQNSCPGNR